MKKKITYKILFCLSVISAFFSSYLFAAQPISIENQTNYVYTNKGNTTIDANNYGIYFRIGANNTIRNTETGVLNITAQDDGIEFNDATDSNFTNEGNTTIDANQNGIAFYLGANNTIRNTETGVL
ncbi:MAG: hypothetical protein JRJ44_08935, partial [Deltaproteobacteria bacterium]|nr:hypothetical protein [Deltaproteobacteria bacterium]